MQTFLPHPDYAESAKVLDQKRLGKQRLECLQLIRTNLGYSTGWANHPAAVMWRKHSAHLLFYSVAVVEEWVGRGYRNTIDFSPFFEDPIVLSELDPPPWLGDPAFHASHRSNLLRKNLAHYAQFGWTDNPEDPYVWPTT